MGCMLVPWFDKHQKPMGFLSGPRNGLMDSCRSIRSMWSSVHLGSIESVWPLTIVATWKRKKKVCKRFFLANLTDDSPDSCVGSKHFVDFHPYGASSKLDHRPFRPFQRGRTARSKTGPSAVVYQSHDPILAA